MLTILIDHRDADFMSPFLYAIEPYPHCYGTLRVNTWRVRHPNSIECTKYVQLPRRVSSCGIT
jgi:hypothetical protein